MPNMVSNEVRDQMREAYLAAKGIKAIAREFGVGRNTVRRLVRGEGLVQMAKESHRESSPSKKPVKDDAPLACLKHELWALDFSFLEKLFELGKNSNETLQFKSHIKKLTESIATELGIQNSPLDQVRLEMAISELISYRRFYIRSFTAADASYAGPYAKMHDKVARAGLRWATAAQRSLDTFSAIIRDLEIKYRKRIQPISGSFTAIQINGMSRT